MFKFSGLLSLALMSLIALSQVSARIVPFDVAREFSVCYGNPSFWVQRTGAIAIGSDISLVNNANYIGLASGSRACRHFTRSSHDDSTVPMIVSFEEPQMSAARVLADESSVIFLNDENTLAYVEATSAGLRDLESHPDLAQRMVIAANDVNLAETKHRLSRRTPVTTATEARQEDNSAKEKLLNGIRTNDYSRLLASISGEIPLIHKGQQFNITTRYIGTPESEIVSDYFVDVFELLGYQSIVQPFTFNGIETHNVIAIKPGTGPNRNEVVVFGAHMDSTSPKPTTIAPGAIDNGSGTAAVMLAAQAMANVKTDRTVHFVLFGAEEHGLIGSRYYVSQLSEAGVPGDSAGEQTVTKALVMDMIGYSDKYFGVLIEGTPDADIQDLMSVMAQNVEQHAPELSYEKSDYSFGSDHVPFQNAGIPCFLAIELDQTDYPGYHKTSDTVFYLNAPQAVGITRAQVGTLYDLVM